MPAEIGIIYFCSWPNLCLMCELCGGRILLFDFFPCFLVKFKIDKVCWIFNFNVTGLDAEIKFQVFSNS